MSARARLKRPEARRRRLERVRAYKRRMKALNKEVVERWHANNAEHTNRVPKGNTERGLRDLNQMINPVLKLGKNG